MTIHGFLPWVTIWICIWPFNIWTVNPWQTFAFIPIYKKGPTHDKTSYNPVSLTSIRCYAMERFVRHSILTTWSEICFSITHSMAAPNGSPLTSIHCAQHDISTLHDARQGVEVAFGNPPKHWMVPIIVISRSNWNLSILCKWDANFLSGALWNQEGAMNLPLNPSDQRSSPRFSSCGFALPYIHHFAMLHFAIDAKLIASKMKSTIFWQISGRCFGLGHAT